MKIVYTASVQGQQMELVSAKNNKASMQQMNMMGMSIMNSVYDGEDVKTVMQGREIPIEDDKKKDLAIEAKIFPELYYGEMDIDFELTGIVLLDGKKAYKMKITMPSGTETVQYFNQESGLLIKTVVGPVITEIKEYKEVEGVMIPAKMMINQGVQIGAELKSAEVNANLTSDTFVIK
jgi:zinc protease